MRMKGIQLTRTTKTFSISLPPQMATKIEELMREEGRTRSELLREALRRYVEERELKSLYHYGERKARAKGITTEKQVADLVHARRVKEI